MWTLMNTLYVLLFFICFDTNFRTRNISVLRGTLKTLKKRTKELSNLEQIRKPMWNSNYAMLHRVSEDTAGSWGVWANPQKAGKH